MSWRGSTGQIDSNVPDYQKMLQSRYPSSGWSSTQSGLSALTGRSQLYSHTGTSQGYGKSSRGYEGTYQPSRYSLGADSLYSSTLDPHIRAAQSEEGIFRGDSEKHQSNIRRGYDHEPYNRDYSSDTGHGHSAGRRYTDYSSDSGHTNNQVPSYLTGYTSDSGTGRGLSLDYGSDTGVLNQARHRRKSSEFELDIPSPGRSQFKRDDHIDFISPVKSHYPLSDYLPYSHTQSSYTENQNLYDTSTSSFHRDSQNHEPKKNGTHADIEAESSPTINNIGTDEENVTEQTEDDRLRMNFMSPPLYHGDVTDTKLPHRDNRSGKIKPGSLTDWQQSHSSHSVDPSKPHSHSSHHRHSSDSYHRHAKEKHPHSNKLSHQSSQRSVSVGQHYTSSDRLSHHGGHGATSPGQQHSSSEQINHIRSAADAIIRDKDAIIDELRGQVVNLEEAIKEYENKLRRTLMTRGAHSGESASFNKMQDLEYRNAELRSELAKLKLNKDTEIEDLEIKLGGVEHEVVTLKAALRKAQPNAAEMRDKFEEKQNEVDEWETKYSRLNQSYEDMKEKLGGLERYLSDLPTNEEFNKTSTELAKCREELEVKEEQIGDLEDRLKELTEQLSDREVTIQDLRGRQQQMANKLHEMSTEIKRLKSEGEGKELSQALDELAEVKEVKDRLALDLEKAKKLLEMNHRRLRQLEVKHQTDKQQVQERLVQEEESGTALREELRMKEEQLAKLKRSIKEFASKNQDLMDEGLILKEQIKQFELMSTDENQRLQRKFVKEMGICFAELQSLVQICIQRAEGKDPNISLLLGMRTSSLDDEEEGAAGGHKKEEQTIKHWFKKLRELQAEVENVRKMICNKCAEEMGDNLNCATQ